MKSNFFLIFSLIISSMSCIAQVDTNETLHQRNFLEELRSNNYKYKFYFLTKKIKSVTEYNHNKKNGLYVKFFKNGGIEIKGSYKNDVENGIWKFYYRDKILWKELNFIEGKASVIKVCNPRGGL